MIKEIIIFLAGGAVGGILAALYFDKKYQKRTEEEVASMQEYVAKIREKEILLEKSKDYTASNDKDGKEELTPDKVSTKISMVKEGEHYKPGSLAGTANVDYTKFYGRDPAEDEYPSDEEDEYRKAEMVNERLSKKGSEIIEAGDMEDYPEFDKVILYYYAYNNIMVYGEPENEEESMIEDEDEILGSCWSESGFAAVDDTRDVLYIRNYDRATDYEIQKIFSTYEWH